jgi:hypothetical protein
MKDLREYYSARRIYLPENVAKQVDEFERHLATILLRHGQAQKLEGTMSADMWLKMVNEIDDMMDKETPRLFEQLETEFRKLLGS